MEAQLAGAFHYKAGDRYLYYGNIVKSDSSFLTNDLYKDARLFNEAGLVNIRITIDDKTSGLIIASIQEPTTFKIQTNIGDEKMMLRYNIMLELKKRPLYF